ncbi:helix-turn-helix domain-containing protein [Tenacibaculum xiamenense]|uniref:helix-turn-helix domain-containing protein n=1 Tax=Tenacibaculum xiamenense TaxID=1261553 RepID=UPI0038B43B80
MKIAKSTLCFTCKAYLLSVISLVINVLFFWILHAFSKKHRNFASFGGVVFSFFWGITPFSSFAQTTENQKVEYYYSKAIEFSHSNSDSLIFYAKKIQLSDNKCDRMKGLLYEARGLYIQNNLNRCKKIVLLVVNDLNGSEDDCNRKNLVDGYRRLFYIYKNEGNYEKALFYLLKRKEVLETFNPKEEYYQRNIFYTKNSEAILKIKLGLYEESLGLLKESYKLSESLRLLNPSYEIDRNFAHGKIHVLNATGDVFLSLSKKNKTRILLDSAEYYYKKAFEYSNVLTDRSSHTEAVYRMREINVLFEKRNYEMALDNLRKYDSLFKNYPSYINKTYYRIKAMSLRNNRNNDSSLYFSKKYIGLFGSEEINRDNLTSIYSNVAKIYQEKGKADSALKYSNLALENLKKIDKIKVNTLIGVHDSEKRDFKNKEHQEEKRGSDSKTGYYLLISLVFTSVVFIIYFLKKPTKKHKTEEKKNLPKEFEEKILEGILLFEKSDLYLSSEFNINELANHLGTNSTYISMIINSYKQKSFKQYLAELRINYVIHKLKTDSKFAKYSIVSIANEVGYKNASSFTRAFKNLIGITPSEFIKNKKYMEL